MPVPGKRPQGNGTLAAIITFVALFVVASVAAVIFYIKYEEQKTIANTAKTDLGKIMSSQEQTKGVGKLIGNTGNKSAVGTLLGYVDQLTYTIISGTPEDTTAEVKVNRAVTRAADIRQKALNSYPDITTEPNLTGTANLAEILLNKLGDSNNTIYSLRQELSELHVLFDDSQKFSQEKEKKLLAEKDQLQMQVSDIRSDYNDLKTLLEQNSEQRVGSLLKQLDSEKSSHGELKKDFAKTQAELSQTKEKMDIALKEVRDIQPVPDIEVAAYKPDGSILFVDSQLKIVQVNLGSDDKIYPGLTFSVYNKNAPIPKDGKGKAEIEIYNVEKSISQARILTSKVKDPVIESDLIANLIWDKNKQVVFVISGDFDINHDDKADPVAETKIAKLISKQNGVIGDSVTPKTDYIILGTEPKVIPKPTLEELELYPTAMAKYEASVKKNSRYKEIKEQASKLSIPVFNFERFLYFAGYKTQSQQAGAFE